MISVDSSNWNHLTFAHLAGTEEYTDYLSAEV